MKLKTVFTTCSRICKVMSKSHPDRGMQTDEGWVSLSDLSKELDNLCNWCYKDTIDVQKVVRCKNCVHYKKFKCNKEKHPYDHTSVMMCKMTKTRREPDFFCSEGREKPI